MKRVLCALLLLASLAMLSCSSKQKIWSPEQRVEFITSLNPYRNMVYLNELEDPEFVVFTADLSGEVEGNYPIYTEFILMPSLSDSLDVWVVAAIVDDLDEDASNMRYLYPYRTLIAQGVLPAGLDHQGQMNFYRCFAAKVNAHFTSLEQFFYAVITNAIDPNAISKMQAECAADLFDFTVVETTVETIS